MPIYHILKLFFLIDNRMYLRGKNSLYYNFKCLDWPWFLHPLPPLYCLWSNSKATPVHDNPGTTANSCPPLYPKTQEKVESLSYFIPNFMNKNSIKPQFYKIDKIKSIKSSILNTLNNKTMTYLKTFQDSDSVLWVLCPHHQTTSIEDMVLISQSILKLCNGLQLLFKLQLSLMNLVQWKLFSAVS